MASQENPQLPQRVRNQDDIAEGTRFLLELDPSLADEIAQLDGIPLRLRPPGFAGLAQIVTGQQVSRASASAMFERLEVEVSPLTASTLLAVGEKPLIQAGLSRAKQKTLISLADSIVNGGLDLDRICVVPQSEAMAALTALHGIGPWTAEVFLLFCAGHMDVFPAGDIALQQAMVDLGICLNRPDEKQARQIAQSWQPVRAIAARVLWAVYARHRRKDVLPV